MFVFHQKVYNNMLYTLYYNLFLIDWIVGTLLYEISEMNKSLS
jgi:hypothetical protein